MLQLAVLLTVGYLLYLIYEKKSNDRYLSSFRYVIHVNGTRGKTSVCRLIDAALRGSGYKVFTKTTGSTPFYIDTAGNEHLIIRKAPANIQEQLKMIKMAYREHADVLILECMAVNPELQKTAQEQIVKGNLNVITNVRYDHIFDMGDSLDSIAESLSGTIPKDGLLFTADETYFDYFRGLCEKKNTKAVLCRPAGVAETENSAIAYEIARHLGISDEDFLRNLKSYREDFGAQKVYSLNSQARFLNLFSVNDPMSTKKVLKQYVDNTEEVTFVYNNRQDRPDRLLLFARHFFPEVPCKKILIIGENKEFARRLLKKHGFSNVETASGWKAVLDISDSAFVAGLGNIKGDAYHLIDYLEAKGAANK